MSVHNSKDIRKVTTHRLNEMKSRNEKISMLTAYDYTMASIVDKAGVDVILVAILHLMLSRKRNNFANYIRPK